MGSWNKTFAVLLVLLGGGDFVVASVHGCDPTNLECQHKDPTVGSGLLQKTVQKRVIDEVEEDSLNDAMRVGTPIYVLGEEAKSCAEQGWFAVDKDHCKAACDSGLPGRSPTEFRPLTRDHTSGCFFVLKEGYEGNCHWSDTKPEIMAPTNRPVCQRAVLGPEAKPCDEQGLVAVDKSQCQAACDSGLPGRSTKNFTNTEDRKTHTSGCFFVFSHKNADYNGNCHWSNTAQKDIKGRPMLETNRPVCKHPTATSFEKAVKDKAAKRNLGEFSLLVGDANGIVHNVSVAGKSEVKFSPDGQPMKMPGSSNIRRPMPVFSAGKWPVAAALGAAVKSGSFKWDDPVNKYIDWWATDTTDKRSKITFAHLLSHTSGLPTSAAFLHAMRTPMSEIVKRMTKGLAAQVGLWNDAYTMEECAKAVFNATNPSIMPTPGSQYDYQETHYLVAQYAAMKATDSETWQDFFFTYWGSPLGLHREVVAKDWSLGSDAYGYGFWAVRVKTKEDEVVPNPDGGSQLVVSPCAFSRFLTSYVKSENNAYNAAALDEEQYKRPATVGDKYRGYALGHWVWRNTPKIYHSIGAAGAVPMTSTTSDGKPFWVYLSRYDQLTHSVSDEFISDLVPFLQAFMATSPSAKPDVCPLITSTK